jgi:hypothetical protein
MAAKIPHLLFFLLLVPNFTFAQKKCYYPELEATGDHPCDPDAEESVCCGTGGGSMCLTNKACVRPGHDMARGSCTDKTWGSEACPLFCTSGCMCSISILEVNECKWHLLTHVHSPGLHVHALLRQRNRQ